ncbi:MAG TPA: CHASE domain-containing protein, partial [Thermoanaerobaculia bacterium]|nr:CHASE domain-containing protein [Thermoanaerobaculia bacterium]
MNPPTGRAVRALPWIVLALFLILTILAAGYVWTTSRAADRARFDNAVQATHDAIQSRLDAYIDVLTATRGLAVSDPAIEREDLRAYIRGLNVQRRYPGIQGIGFTLRVPPEEVARVEEELRAEGEESFRIWPFTARAEYHTIVLLEPPDRRNATALGYDMSTHPVRRDAMERARDTGRPAATGRVTLVQEIDVRKQPGFLIYTPVYATGTTPDALALRRSALIGFIYAPFRAFDFFHGIFGSQVRPEVGFEIRDRGELLYRSEALPADPRFVHREELKVAGRTWSIEWISRRHAAGGVALLTAGTFAGGVIISLLLFLLLRTQLAAREQAEQVAARLRESEGALQRASQAKDEFLAMLSHELRTPMTSILGWSQMIGEEELDAQTTSTAIDAIRKSAKVQAQLIDDLLDVSRITAGKMRIEPRPVELAPVVTAAIETVRGAADAKQVRLHAELAADICVHGDPHRLQQVVWNLLSNAVKFTPRGGDVFVTLHASDRDAVLEVRDTGQGIDPAFMPHLFERFRQADSSSTRAQPGLGLGLAIVRHLAELHGGRIVAESKGIGRGSTFRVHLPLHVDERPRANRPSRWRRACASRRRR